MAKVRSSRRYIVIEPLKEMPPFTEEKRKNLKILVESYGLNVMEVSMSYREELGKFAHGGTFYGVNVLSIDPPSAFIEDDDFYQYGIIYTRPDYEWEHYVEGASSETLKGGVDEWVKNPYNEANDKGEYVYSTLVLDKDSRPDMFETDKKGRFVNSWKIVPVISK